MRNKQPMVSVIIPNYNHAKYLDLRLQTVFEQTYQNIEIIILDDKSTDNSLEIINKYREYSRISHIVINPENSGSPFKQWDKGIALAKGELIWIAESDDYNDLNFLEKIIDEWGKYRNVVIAYSLYVLFNDTEYFKRSKERETQCFNGEQYIRYRMARGNCIMNASGVVFKKEIYDTIDKDFMSFRNAGDYLLWVKILAKGNVLKINKNLTYYRQSDHSVTTACASNGVVAFEIKRVLDYIELMNKLNWWQTRMAYAMSLAYIQKLSYKTEIIRKEVYDFWDEPNHTWRPFSIIVWLIGTIERHFGILF